MSNKTTPTLDIMKSLVKARKAQGITQREVAKRMHRSASVVSRMERTDDQFLRILDIRAYGEAVGMRLLVFFAPMEKADS